jgi:hypothetical protein
LPILPPAPIRPEVTNGPFLSHKRTEREHRCGGVAEFRRKRRLSLRTALTGKGVSRQDTPPPRRSPWRRATYCFPLNAGIRPFQLWPLMRKIRETSVMPCRRSRHPAPAK